MTQRAFFLNGRRCTGCKTCQMACIDLHDLPAGRTFRRVYEYTSGGWGRDADGRATQDLFGYYLSVSCNHCDEPACVPACPTGAIAKDGETGLVTVDASSCTGCGACAQACPYDAIAMDVEQGVATKCDGCAARVKAGMAPVCVEACPMRALYAGDAGDAPQGYERADVAPLPPADETRPNLFVLAPRHAERAGDAAAVGVVTNPEELGL